MAPSLRRIFPADMTEQKRKLMISSRPPCRASATSMRSSPQMMELGARHATYGVTDDHYKIVGETLIWTLERGIASEFTPEVRRAWVRVYRLIAATMQAGADEALTMQAASEHRRIGD